MGDDLSAIILGIVQGLTEFLPISSSGHLIVLPDVFGWSGTADTLEFDVALHVGTTIAVVCFFWSDWLRIGRSFLRNLGKNVAADFDSKLLLMILVGSIPAAIVGLAFKDFIEEDIREPILVASTLLAFALVLLLADRIGSRTKAFGQIGWLDAILVGIAQAVSLVPGVSRSGITISAGMFKGLNREAATRFSFLLSTPAIVGAAILSMPDLLDSSGDRDVAVFVGGTISAAITGWLTIGFLLRFVQSNTFIPFVVYRLLIGAAIVAWVVIG